MTKAAKFAGEMTGLDELDSGVPPIPMMTVTQAHLRAGPGKTMPSVAVMGKGVEVGALPINENGWRLVWLAGWMHESTLAKLK